MFQLMSSEYERLKLTTLYDVHGSERHDINFCFSSPQPSQFFHMYKFQIIFYSWFCVTLMITGHNGFPLT